MFSWVEVFEKRIQEKRANELQMQLSKFHLGMIAIAFTFLWPQLMSTLTLSAFVFFGNSLDLSTAYTIKIIFNYVKDPMRMLPIFISQLVEFRLSMYRIQEFLLCDEINPTITNLYNFKQLTDNPSGSLQQKASQNLDAHQLSATSPALPNPTNAAITLRFKGNFHWGTFAEEQLEAKKSKAASTQGGQASAGTGNTRTLRESNIRTSKNALSISSSTMKGEQRGGSGSAEQDRESDEDMELEDSQASDFTSGEEQNQFSINSSMR